jgi:hypothetical protein
VAALSSAFPGLWPHRVGLALVLLAIIMTANLRGLRESGTLIAAPVYLFVFSYLAMIAFGIARAVIEGAGTLPAASVEAAKPLTLVLILHTFSSGCTALTGVEAISNGVTIFKQPETRNARQTLVVMAGDGAGCWEYRADAFRRDRAATGAIHQVARRILGPRRGVCVRSGDDAAVGRRQNTGYVDFPRVCSPSDEPLPPRQLSRWEAGTMGLSLSALVAVLIIAFGVTIPSSRCLQLGCSGIQPVADRHGRTLVSLRGTATSQGVLQRLGAITTCSFFVVAVSKFLEGVIIAVLVQALILMFRTIGPLLSGPNFCTA